MKRFELRAAVERAQAVAGRQHGLIGAQDLEAAGLGRRVVERLVTVGLLRRLYRGVYLIGGGQPSRWQMVVATWMAGGPSSAISHATAAAIHKLPHLVPDEAAPLEMTIQGTPHPRPAGVRVHRTRRLSDADVSLHRGIRLTSPPRTLVDMAHRLPPGLLARAIDEGCIAQLWTPETLSITRRRSPGRTDLAVFDRLLGLRLEAPSAGRDLEARVEALLRPLGPFETQFQVVLDGRVIITDIAVPALKLAVECDGWAVRGRSRQKFDGDRRRNNLLAAHGWTVVHLTSDMSDDEMRSAVVSVLVRLATMKANATS